MPNNKDLLTKHLFFCSIVLVILAGLLFLSLSLVEELFAHPNKYFFSNFSSSEIQRAIVSISLIVVSVLVSYLLYLLLSLKTRTELIVRRTTRNLAKSREQFVRLYENAPVPYITLNEKGEIREPNKAALRFFGVVPEEIDGKNIFSFHPEEDTEQAEKLAQYYRLDLPVNREEIRMITKSGAIKWVLLSIFEIGNPGDNTKTGLVSIFDITEEKRLDQAKTEFVSLASHQLRAPLATTKWYTEMLISGDLGEIPPKQKEYLSRVYLVNENMIDLVDTLLSVSRVEIGSLKIELKQTDVEDLCESVLDELSPQINKKKIKVDKKYNGLLKDLKTDPKLLRIVIQNLVSNAIKYTPDEGQITISLEQSDGKKQIIVSDTGLGIPKSQQNLIFSKMFRADNVRDLTNNQGTGLGLYMVKSMIEAMGGNVSFVSEEGHGSIFTVTL